MRKAIFAVLMFGFGGCASQARHDQVTSIVNDLPVHVVLGQFGAYSFAGNEDHPTHWNPTLIGIMVDQRRSASQEVLTDKEVDVLVCHASVQIEVDRELNEWFGGSRYRETITAENVATHPELSNEYFLSGSILLRVRSERRKGEIERYLQGLHEKFCAAGAN